MAAEGKLAAFLREASNWGWEEFVRAEKDPSYSSNQAMIFALIRSCAMRNLPAIKVAISRLDGKLKTPIRIEYPKVFFVFPNAKQFNREEPHDTNTILVTRGDATSDMGGRADPTIEGEVVESDVSADSEPETDLPSMSLRQTLIKMADYPRELPEAITQLALETEIWCRKKGPQPQEIPKVKSVVAAHLLIMAQSRNIDALTEVFDNIDGKLVETIQILGDDLYITNYSIEAPAGAYLNNDGVLQIEATDVQNMWASRLGKADV